MQFDKTVKLKYKSNSQFKYKRITVIYYIFYINRKWLFINSNNGTEIIAKYTFEIILCQIENYVVIN